MVNGVLGTNIMNIHPENVEKYTKVCKITREELETYGELYRNQGHLTRQQLYSLTYEISPKNGHLIMENTKNECELVTSNILGLDDDFSRITIICGLSGFDIPTASYVLVALDPERYAITTIPVWTALARAGYLDESRTDLDVEDYCVMIEHMRDIAEETGLMAADIGYTFFARGVSSSA